MKPRILHFTTMGNSLQQRRWIAYFHGLGWTQAIAARHVKGVELSPGVELFGYGSRLADLAGKVSWRARLRVLDVAVRDILRRFRPDLIHAHWINGIAHDAARTGFHPLVVTPWGSDILILSRRSAYVERRTRETLRCADIVTCWSELMAERCQQLGANPDHCVRMLRGVDVERFRPGLDTTELRRRLGIEQQRVIFSNRRSREIYNLPTIMRAFGLLARTCERVVLLMLVDSQQAASDLQDLARSLGVEHRVRIQEWVSHEDLPQFYCVADVYVSTASSDNLGYSTLEAMACGTFPVVSDVGGILEWVTDGKNGFVVPPGNAGALAEAFKMALTSRDLLDRAIRQNRAMVVNGADYRTEMARMADRYVKLVRAHGT